jgi:hypothetical protein
MKDLQILKIVEKSKSMKQRLNWVLCLRFERLTVPEQQHRKMVGLDATCST